MDKYAFYIIKDSFFERFNDPCLRGNKKENRPHYYCFKDDTDDLFWVIPMSNRAEKYKQIIQNKQSFNKPCDILHVCKLSNGRENAFLIQDMFPITEEYILRPYTVAENPMVLIKELDKRTVEQKALRILNLINRGIKFNYYQVDSLKIKQELLKDLSIKTVDKELLHT